MSGPLNELDKQAHDEFCCTLSALILHDEGLDITADKINKLVNASGNKIDPYWAPLFAKAIAGRNVGDLLAGGGAPAPQQQAAATEAPKDKKEPAKKKEEKVEEEADVEGAMDLFGGDDDF
jgi:large subunit ribosomal protein LP1